VQDVEPTFTMEMLKKTSLIIIAKTLQFIELLLDNSTDDVLKKIETVVRRQKRSNVIS